MLDLTPRKLREAIMVALTLRRDVTRHSAALIRQYAADSRATWAAEDAGFENHNYEWVVNIVPNLVFTNPTVRVTDMGFKDQRTEDVERAMKSWVAQTKLNWDLTQIAYDMQFDFGIGYVCLEPTPGLRQPGEFRPMRPRLRRLSPRQYFKDARTPEFGRPRFEGHIFVKDYDEMAAEVVIDPMTGTPTPKYDLTALGLITKDDGLDELRKDLMQDGIDLGPDQGKAIVGFEVYVRDESGGGKWLTLGFTSGGDAAFLREEREYAGPRGGCYQDFGVYVIPDQVYPLAALAVTRKQVEEINKHRWQAAQDAESAKQVAVVNGQAQGVIGTLQDAPSGSIISIPGFQGQVQTIVMGGMMPQTAEYVAEQKGFLDRLSGLNEVIRGNITGSATATEIAQASNYADIRIKYAVSRFRDCTAQSLGKVADLMWSDKSVVFPITAEIDDGAGGQVLQRGTFMGGTDEMEDPENPWMPNPTIEIEPYSMEFTNQNTLRQQMMEFQQSVLQVAQAQMTMPFLKGQNMLNDLGSTLNIGRSGDRYIDWRGLLMQMQMQAAMQAEAAANGEKPGDAGGETKPAGKPAKVA